MKLWKVCILCDDYFYGKSRYNLFVLADTEENMKKCIYNHRRYKESDNAEIESFIQVDLSDQTNRVLPL